MNLSTKSLCFSVQVSQYSTHAELSVQDHVDQRKRSGPSSKILYNALCQRRGKIKHTCHILGCLVFEQNCCSDDSNSVVSCDYVIPGISQASNGRG